MHRAGVTDWCGDGCEQRHSALRAAAGLGADHLRVHRAGIGERAPGGTPARPCPSRRRTRGSCPARLEVGSDAGALGKHVGVRPQLFELVLERWLRLLVGDADRGERVGAVGRPVLERQLSRLLEEHVDDNTLRGRQDESVDELLALVAAAVAADALHPRARNADVEDSRVRRVRQVEAHDFSLLRVQRRARVHR